MAKGEIHGGSVNVTPLVDDLEPDVTDIKAKTDNLPSDPADASVVAGNVTTAHSTTDALVTSSHSTTDGLIASEHVTTDALVTSEHSATDGLINTVDGFHDVPSQNSADNAQIRDVIGNKTDNDIGNSIYSKVYIIEEHFHNRERWFGISANQTGTNWCTEARLTSFQAISGNGTWGGDANDEAKLIGSTDTPFITGKTSFDLHRILIVDVSNDDEYYLRFVYGTGTMADAITAGQYSLVMVKFDSLNPQQSAGVPIDIMCALDANGVKFWCQAANSTNNATINFYFGAHGY